jgi:capsular exopolysaccharide synthesis family protein
MRQLNIYTQKREEAEISSQLAGFSTSNISVVDAAMIPKRPISPNKTRSLMMAFVLGLFGGVGLCLLLDYLDNTVNSPDDIKNLADIPSLGVIPYLSPDGLFGDKSQYFSKYKDFYSYGDDSHEDELDLDAIKNIELINHHHPKFFISEDYRTIRTSILLSNADSTPQTLLFTSALPMEGKTTTTTNVAVSFAQLAEKVLIIDSDLRKPRLHRIFSVDNVGGLSSYLIGKIQLSDAIKMSSIQNIWILPSGPIPPNPAEIINSSRMKELLHNAKHDFDIIILDSPPLLAAIDTVVLSSIIDAVVLVVRAGKTTNNAFLRAHEELKKARSNLIGVVINETELSRSGYYLKDYYHGGAYNNK